MGQAGAAAGEGGRAAGGGGSKEELRRGTWLAKPNYCFVGRRTHSPCPPACHWAPLAAFVWCSTAKEENGRQGAERVGQTRLLKQAGEMGSCMAVAAAVQWPTCSTAAFCCLAAGRSRLRCADCFFFCCFGCCCCCLHASSRKAEAQSPSLSRRISRWNQSRPCRSSRRHKVGMAGHLRAPSSVRWRRRDRTAGQRGCPAVCLPPPLARR